MTKFSAFTYINVPHTWIIWFYHFATSEFGLNICMRNILLWVASATASMVYAHIHHRYDADTDLLLSLFAQRKWQKLVCSLEMAICTAYDGMKYVRQYAMPQHLSSHTRVRIDEILMIFDIWRRLWVSRSHVSRSFHSEYSIHICYLWLLWMDVAWNHWCASNTRINSFGDDRYFLSKTFICIYVYSLSFRGWIIRK